MLPQAPAGHDDYQQHALIRAVLEDIATSPLAAEITQEQRQDLLAAIDATPVGYRSALGEMWSSWLAEMAGTGRSETRWRFRGHIWQERPYLIFGASARHDEDIQRKFGTYVSLRHQQQAEVVPERLGTLTVGEIRAGRCPCEACPGELSDPTRSRGGRGFCRACSCAWRVSDIDQKRYAATVPGDRHREASAR